MQQEQAFSVVLITDSYEPYVDATSALNVDLVSALSSQYQVTVFAPIPYSQFNRTTAFSRSRSGVYYRRFPVPFSTARSPFLKLLKFVFFLLFSAAYIMLKKNPKSLYLVHSSPPSQIPLFAILVSLRNVFSRKMRRLVLVLHDLYPDIISGPVASTPLLRLIVSISSRLFMISYNSYDMIIVCSAAIKKVLSSKYDVPVRNIETIYNWSIFENVANYERSSTSALSSSCADFAQIHYPSSHPLFLVGNLGPLHLPEQSYKLLANIASHLDLPTYCFVKGYSSGIFNSPCDDDKSLFKVMPWLTPSQLFVEYERHRPITFVSLSLSACSCAFPSRISASLSCGSPILFFTDNTNGNFVSNMLLEAGVGKVLSVNSTLNDAVFALESLRAQYDAISKRCLSFYDSQMSRRFSLSQYLASLASLT